LVIRFPLQTIGVCDLCLLNLVVLVVSG
jgi:hypothetical protein